MDNEWIDKTIGMKYVTVDERAILRFYRFCKHNWKFFLGVAVTLVIVLFVIK